MDGGGMLSIPFNVTHKTETDWDLADSLYRLERAKHVNHLQHVI